MYTNTTLSSLSRIPFGYSYIANQRAMKTRYTIDLAEAILMNIPKHFHKSLSICVTTNKKGMQYCYIACIAHTDSAIWAAINKAAKLGKIYQLRALVSRKEAELEADQFAIPFEIDLPW